MSMHKIELTDLERKGLELHRLPIWTPSILSNAFRFGVKWALENTRTQSPIDPDTDRPCVNCGISSNGIQHPTNSTSAFMMKSIADKWLAENGHTDTQSQWIDGELVPAINKCFPCKISCDDTLLVRVNNYNELVDLINKAVPKVGE